MATILFTSGTTGRAKGTLHFHRDLLAVTDCFPRHVLRPTEDDIRPGSTGRVVPGYRARIVDEQGRKVAAGADPRLGTGSVWSRGRPPAA